MKRFIIPLVFISLLISCDNSQGTSTKEVDKQSINWTTLIIESTNQTITIGRDEKYGIRDTCDFEEVRIDEYLTEYKPINRGLEYFEIDEQEKDSLFAYVYEIVTKPVYTDQFATCYVGNISIGFRTPNTTLICKYISVGNWATISPPLSKLYSLLQQFVQN